MHKPPIFSHIFKVNSRRLNAEKELQERKILAFFKEIKMKNELQAASHGFRVAVSQNKDDLRFGLQTRILFEMWESWLRQFTNEFAGKKV